MDMKLTPRAIMVVALILLAAPLAARAQEARKVWRIGYLSTSLPEIDRSWLGAFEQGLRDLGYVDGKNIVIERRHSGGAPQRLPELAAELVRLKVDVVVAYGGIDAIKKASGTIPIVMAVHADPVRAGVVASLARPAGQVTGLSDLHAGLTTKRLELLKEMVPEASRVAVLLNPAAEITGPQLNDIQAAAPALGLSVLPLEVRGADDIHRAFATMRKVGVDGFLVVGEPTVMGTHRRLIADLAIKNRLPGIGTQPQWASDGLLMSYGTNFHDLWRRAATYVDKILKGAKPADLPIEQPTKFELVVNLKTAKALGLNIPPPVRLRADHLIE